MEEQFYSILTKVGKAKIANASALGTKVNFTTFVLGDGGGNYYNPIEDQITLKNQVWSGPVNNLNIDKSNNNWIVAEVLIPADIGNFMIREAGILDDEGNLLVIGKYPETYKPIASNGSTKDLTIRMILEVSNTAAVTLKVDQGVMLAHKEDVEAVQKKVESLQKQVDDEKNAAVFTNIYTKFTAEEDNVGHIPIGHANFNPEQDILNVKFLNEILTKEVNYNINSDNLSIDLIDWVLEKDETIYFEAIKKCTSMVNESDGSLLEENSVNESKLSKSLQNKINKEIKAEDIKSNDGVTLEKVKEDFTSHLVDNMYQTAGGTATAITLTINGTLANGYPITFIASANNSGAATTINNKKLYKPNTTTAPNLIAGKAYTIWYSAAGDSGNGCFFIKASAEGNTIASHVLAGDTFSNYSDTGLIGTLDLSNLTANNIRKDVTINGVTGSSLKYGIGDYIDPYSLGSYPVLLSEQTINGLSSYRYMMYKFGYIFIVGWCHYLVVNPTTGALVYSLNLPDQDSISFGVSNLYATYQSNYTAKKYPLYSTSPTWTYTNPDGYKYCFDVLEISTGEVLVSLNQSTAGDGMHSCIRKLTSAGIKESDSGDLGTWTNDRIPMTYDSVHNLVYYSQYGGYVYQFNPVTMLVTKSLQISGQPNSFKGMYYDSVSGFLYVISGSNPYILYKINVSTMQVIWSYTGDNYLISGSAFVNYLNIVNNVIYLGSASGVIGIDVNTGLKTGSTITTIPTYISGATNLTTPLYGFMQIAQNICLYAGIIANNNINVVDIVRRYYTITG